LAWQLIQDYAKGGGEPAQADNSRRIPALEGFCLALADLSAEWRII
jgi:hypothetical protein